MKGLRNATRENADFRCSSGSVYRVLLWGVSCLLLAAAPSFASLIYLGFGDSITLSTACPIDCGTNFDEANKGGYVGRLETRLGGGRDVRNHGLGGEKTAQGLTRITSILDAGGDVLILMEGTNDVSQGVSPETTRANLSAMTGKATDRGIDTILATTVRRIFNANHSATRDLADEVRNLANTLSRDLADPYLPLCPDNGCFSAHYWPDEIEVGHVDASGYEILTDVFEDVIRADSVPAVPAPVGPQGNTDNKPTYEWTKVSNANWYRLEVENPNNVRVIDRIYEGRLVCSANQCSVTPSGSLADGEHRFRVKSRNLFDDSAFSSWQSFTVFSQKPAKIVSDSPSGDFYDLDPIDFTYQWQADELAVDYRLRVLDAQNVKVVDALVSNGSCNGNDCSVVPSPPLGGGEYTWSVRGENPAGNGSYSTDLELAVWDQAPERVTPLSPKGELFDTTPVFRFTPTPGATSYELEVSETGGSVVAIETISSSFCDASACEYSLQAVLSPGEHDWVVRAENPIGQGLASVATAFDLLLCESPQDVTVAPQVVSGVAVFRACRDLTLGDGVVIKASAEVTFLAGRSVIVEDGFEVEHGATVTFQVDL